MNRNSRNIIPTPSADQTPTTPDNQLPFPPSSDDWRVAFLQRICISENALDRLFKLLDVAWTFSESRDILEFQSEIFAYWAGHEGHDLNAYRGEIRDMVQQAVHLVQLREEFDLFEDATAFSQAYFKQKEGGQVDA